MAKKKKDDEKEESWTFSKNEDEPTTRVKAIIVPKNAIGGCDHCSDETARSSTCKCGKEFTACYAHMNDLVTALAAHKESCTFVEAVTPEQVANREKRAAENEAHTKVMLERQRVVEEEALAHAVRHDNRKKELADRPSAATFARAIQKKARDAIAEHVGRRSPMKIQEGMMAPVKKHGPLQKKPLAYPDMQPRARTAVAPANTTFDMQKPMPKVQNVPKAFHKVSGPVVSRTTPNKNIAAMPHPALRPTSAQTYYKQHALPKKPY